VIFIISPLPFVSLNGAGEGCLSANPGESTLIANFAIGSLVVVDVLVLSLLPSGVQQLSCA